MPDADSIKTHAERIRASGVLSRSRLLQKLFDYLVACSLEGRAPKEVEVAVDVFGRKPGADVAADAVVRVYVHKLRRKLDEFYAESLTDAGERLVIPKGSYRMLLQSAPAGVAVPDSEPVRSGGGGRRWMPVALAASVLLNLLIAVAVYFYMRVPPDDLAAVRASPVWSGILDDQRPILIVLGDYYIFGETGERMDVRRLIREFSINSQHDLERYLKAHPEDAERYIDLELGYLPVAAGYALREVMPVLGPASRRVRLTVMSALDPAEIKTSHVIYIGFLSGLGMMQDLVFAGSRFSVGETYDELIDAQSGRHYVSQGAGPLRSETRYADYGYFSTFGGPDGNQIIIIAGTRDVAVMQTAEVTASPARLNELVRSAGEARAFEALYEAYGLDRTNLDGQLLLTSQLDSARIWADASGHLTSALTEFDAKDQGTP